MFMIVHVLNCPFMIQNYRNTYIDPLRLFLDVLLCFTHYDMSRSCYHANASDIIESDLNIQSILNMKLTNVIN